MLLAYEVMAGQPMRTEEKQVNVNFKMDEQLKRRFDAAMRVEGTTVSEQLRQAVKRYLEALEAGEKDPQMTVVLTPRSRV